MTGSLQVAGTLVLVLALARISWCPRLIWLAHGVWFSPLGWLASLHWYSQLSWLAPTLWFSPPEVARSHPLALSDAAGSLIPYGSLFPSGSLNSHGSLNDDGSLRWNGALQPFGSLLLCGTLNPRGSLGRHGTLAGCGSPIDQPFPPSNTGGKSGNRETFLSSFPSDAPHEGRRICASAYSVPWGLSDPRQLLTAVRVDIFGVDQRDAHACASLRFTSIGRRGVQRSDGRRVEWAHQSRRFFQSNARRRACGRPGVIIRTVAGSPGHRFLWRGCQAGQGELLSLSLCTDPCQQIAVHSIGRAGVNWLARTM